MKILIVDDDELVRMTCRNVLKKEGYTVLEAGNGNEGLESIKNDTPDLVITDMLMPDKEGLETITEIRELNPEIKIIAISSGGVTKNMGFLELAQKVGADRTLKKPLKPAELLGNIKELLGG